jgi:hypothetical protein
MQKKFIISAIVQDNENTVDETTVEAITELLKEALDMHCISYENLEVREQ